MKKVVFLPVLIMLLTLYSCHEKSSQDVFDKVMVLQSKGEVSVQPDEASISMDIECVDKNIEKARDCLLEKSENLNNQLRKRGVDEKDILTTSVNLNKKYQWINNSNVFVGYQATISTHVTIKDLDVLGPLYTSLLTNEAVNIGGLSYSHSKMDSLRHAAYADALKKNNALADELLTQMGKSQKKIVHIGNTASTSGRQYDKYKAVSDFKFEEAEAKTPIQINRGTVYVSSSLNVEYVFK